MNFFKALTYPMEDEQALQKLIPSLLFAAIPIVGFFVMKGYQYQISQAVRRGEKRPLPKWGSFWQTFKRGVIIRTMGFLYNIPSYIMIVISLGFWVTLFVQFFQSDTRTFQTFWALFEQTLVPRLLLLGLTLLVALLANIFYWAGYVRYIDTGQISSFFQFADNLVVTITTIWDDLIMAVYLVIMGTIVGLLSTIFTSILTGTGIGAFLAPIVFPAVSLTLMTSFSGYLFGRLALNTFGPIEEKPVPDIREVARQIRY